MAMGTVYRHLDRKLALRAFAEIDARLDGDTHLVVGGGAAMSLAYGHPLTTEDVDAFAARGGLSMAQLDTAAREVAAKLDLAPDWLNAHFVTFTHVLPSDYGARLREAFRGAHLVVSALGPEDLLVMKCFSGRDKDRGHARRLLDVVMDLDVVSAHLDALIEKRVPGAQRAADWFDDLCDEVGA
jgi:hypothetical protein